MRGKAIFCHLAAHLYLCAAKHQCVFLLLRQVEQAFARGFLVLIAGNEDRCVWISGEACSVPDAWPACEHSATGKNACGWSRQDALALPLIAYKCHVSTCERCVPLADLPL